LLYLFNIFALSPLKLYDLIKIINTKYKKFIIRLFIDNSIYNDTKLFNKLKILNIEIVIYSCPNYIINNIHHYGTFGTLIRFFPMFNFPNNDADLVIIQDADFIEKKLDGLIDVIDKLDLYNNYKNFYILKIPDISTNFDNFNIIYKNIFNSYTVASAFISISKIDYNIISIRPENIFKIKLRGTNHRHFYFADLPTLCRC